MKIKFTPIIALLLLAQCKNATDIPLTDVDAHREYQVEKIYKQDKYQEVIQEYKTLYDKNPNSTDAMYLYAIVTPSKDIVRTLTYKILRINPRNFWGLIKAGYLEENVVVATDYYKQAIKSNPKSPIPYLNLYYRYQKELIKKELSLSERIAFTDVFIFYLTDAQLKNISGDYKGIGRLHFDEDKTQFNNFLANLPTIELAKSELQKKLEQCKGREVELRAREVNRIGGIIGTFIMQLDITYQGECTYLVYFQVWDQMYNNLKQGYITYEYSDGSWKTIAIS